MCVDHPPLRVYSHKRDTGSRNERSMLTIAARHAHRATCVVVSCAAVVLVAQGGVPAVRTEAVQAPAGQATARVEPGLTLHVEGFCSETRLRTSNARITWRARASALGAGVASLATATQRLETTVFKNGFDRGLFVALPIGDAAADRPIAAVAQAPAAQQQPPRRAYQIRLIEVNAARAAVAAADTSEMDAVVENLEPGMNYTWRMAVDAAAGRMVSPSVSLRALVCPADLVEPPPNQTPRRQP